jgi:outer membrane receptor for ferrienterochelin and colicin
MASRWAAARVSGSHAPGESVQDCSVVQSSSDSASLGAGLPNPDFLPEHSRNWNVGYSCLVGLKTHVQAVLFRSDLRKAIESVNVTDPGGTSAATAYCPNSKIAGFRSEMANIGKEVHEGFELEVRTTPISRLTFDGSYSYLNRNIRYEFAK